MKRTSGYFISAANNRLPRENSQKSFIYVTYNMVYLNINRQSQLKFRIIQRSHRGKNSLLTGMQNFWSPIFL